MKLTISRKPIWGMSPKSRSAAWVMVYRVIATYKGKTFHAESTKRQEAIFQAVMGLV